MVERRSQDVQESQTQWEPQGSSALYQKELSHQQATAGGLGSASGGRGGGPDTFVIFL